MFRKGKDNFKTDIISKNLLIMVRYKKFKRKVAKMQSFNIGQFNV